MIINKVNCFKTKNYSFARLYNLNYAFLGSQFSELSTLEKKIFKIKGGEIKYQGTWIPFNFSLKILNVIGGFEVLESIVYPIILYIKTSTTVDLINLKKKISCYESFVLNKKSRIWDEIENKAKELKLKESKLSIKLEKKKSKYKKSEKLISHSLNISKFPSKIFLKNKLKIRLTIRIKTDKFYSKNQFHQNINQCTLNKLSNLSETCYSGVNSLSCIETIYETRSQNHLSETSIKNFAFKPVISDSLLSVCKNRYLVIKQEDFKKSKRVFNFKSSILRNETFKMFDTQYKTFNSKPGVKVEQLNFVDAELSINNSNKNLKVSQKKKLNFSKDISCFPKHTLHSAAFHDKRSFNSTSTTPTEIFAITQKKNTYVLNQINKPIVFDAADSSTFFHSINNNYGYDINTKHYESTNEISSIKDVDELIYDDEFCQKFDTNTNYISYSISQIDLVVKKPKSYL